MALHATVGTAVVVTVGDAQELVDDRIMLVLPNLNLGQQHKQ